MPDKPKRRDQGEYMRGRMRTQSAHSRELVCPDPIDPVRRGNCERSLKLFLLTYLATEFYMTWSPDHEKVVQKLEDAILIGGNFAEAMPRGSGKTTIAEGAAIWMTVNGLRRFPVLIGANKDAAIQILENIKAHLANNDLLYADYP